MLRTQQLSYAYSGASTIKFPDLECEQGDNLLIIGQSGTGKTTLLHLMAGLLTPQSGEVIVGEQSLTRMPKKTLDRYRGKNIGLIFQRSHFVKALTVGENLKLASSLAGIPVDDGRVNMLLERLNIAGKRDKKPHTLSQGEQQRVAIARALMNKPAVILADEPTSSLDDINTAQVIDLVTTEADAVGASLIIVTHDQRLKDRFSNLVAL